jgi:hypothetical protein
MLVAERDIDTVMPNAIYADELLLGTEKFHNSFFPKCFINCRKIIFSV